MRKIIYLLIFVFSFSCNGTKDKSLANQSEKDSLLAVIESLKSSTETPVQTKEPMSIKTQKFGFSAIVYTRTSTVYVPEQHMDGYTVQGYSKHVDEDFINLGAIEEMPFIPDEDSKYKYLDQVENKVREKFNFSNGMSWKIKSRDLLIFDTYTEASKKQSFIKSQDNPKFSN